MANEKFYDWPAIKSHRLGTSDGDSILPRQYEAQSEMQ